MDVTQVLLVVAGGLIGIAGSVLTTTLANRHGFRMYLYQRIEAQYKAVLDAVSAVDHCPTKEGQNAALSAIEGIYLLPRGTVHPYALEWLKASKEVIDAHLAGTAPSESVVKSMEECHAGIRKAVIGDLQTFRDLRRLM